MQEKSTDYLHINNENNNFLNRSGLDEDKISLIEKKNILNSNNNYENKIKSTKSIYKINNLKKEKDSTLIPILPLDSKNEKDLKQNFVYSVESGPKIINLCDLTHYQKIFIELHPFIVHGYRIHHNITDCFFSLFTFHNETLNIWSHLIPFIISSIILVYLISSKFIIF